MATASAGFAMMDEYVTRTVAVCAHPRTPLQRMLRLGCKILELSGHGVPWFTLCGTLFAIYACTGDLLLWAHSLNLLALLVVDILLVAPLKLYFKRPRPEVNQDGIPMSVSSVDCYSFPSGHASRSVALAAYFWYMSPLCLSAYLWYAWAAVLSLSRILQGRHHLSDVVVGILAGLVVFDIVRRVFLITATV